jgi:ornithine cyclodeaminase/alanine dehydrogenase-like protein (mu-crystallin family)
VIFDSTGTAVQDTAPAAALYLATQNAAKADLWAMN